MKEIILNRMFSSTKYCAAGVNIGHEIINLYKATNGNNYIYLNSSGNIDKKYVEGFDEIYVLLIENFAPNIKRVIAKAKVIETLESAQMPKGDKCVEKFKKYNISYDNVDIFDLYSANEYNGEVSEKNSFATFKVDAIIKPKGALYITDKEMSADDSRVFCIKTELAKSSMRQFIIDVDEKTKESFIALKNIIDNDQLWEMEDSATKLNVKEYRPETNTNFFNVIKKQDSETIFSNMLEYIFNSDKKLFAKFVREELKINDFTEDFEIKREDDNIDILIIEKNNVIVIENKIKSGINGVPQEYESCTADIPSQLSKYYDIVESKCKDFKRHYYILKPEYQYINKDCYRCGEHYDLISYKIICEFYCDKEETKRIPYGDMFLQGIEKHTKEIDNEIEAIMDRRFREMIWKFKHNK